MAEVESAPPPEDAPAPTTSGPSPPASPEVAAPGESVEQNAVATTAGGTTETVARKVVKKKKKRRPARPQVDPATVKKSSELPPQTGTIFNIWYNKWSGGDREDKFLSRHHAEGRCSIAKDSGYTRADKVPGSYFCLFFARGLCPKGHECEYLHRLPTLHDIFNPNVDSFGRDKHSDYRDDMGGVGSFMRQNRTLYVGRIHVTDDIEEIVARHFEEWGQIERTRVLTARGVAFVTYTNEANSQFAKEAMAHQSLDNNEILNVRWATVDPNPISQARESRRIDEQAAEAVRRALPAEFVAELEGKDPEARKRRKIKGSFELEGYEAPDDVLYAQEAAIESGANIAAPDIAHSEEIDESEDESHPILLDAQRGDASGVAVNGGGGGGLLSSSTLTALNSFHSIRGQNGSSSGFVAKEQPQQSAAASNGLLVDYGSDDDDDT